jgi:nucleotide-binding universal stress UspA family protein
VVAGVDLSEDSVAAARLAAAIGGLADAETLLVNARSPSEIGHKARVSGPRRVDRETLDVREMLDRVASGIEADVGTRSGTRVVVGDAADAIRAAAKGAGQPVLTAVGSRGLGALARVTVGSVSTGVLRAARGPILVYGRP